MESTKINKKRPGLTHLKKIYPLLEDGDSLILERLAELHHLSPLGVDGQGGHDQVGLLVHQLTNQACQN